MVHVGLRGKCRPRLGNTGLDDLRTSAEGTRGQGTTEQSVLSELEHHSVAAMWSANTESIQSRDGD